MLDEPLRGADAESNISSSIDALPKTLGVLIIAQTDLVFRSQTLTVLVRGGVSRGSRRRRQPGVPRLSGAGDAWPKNTDDVIALKGVGRYGEPGCWKTSIHGGPGEAQRDGEKRCRQTTLLATHMGHTHLHKGRSRGWQELSA